LHYFSLVKIIIKKRKNALLFRKKKKYVWTIVCPIAIMGQPMFNQ
jgi:hypothetical protein